jgi:hypothetical protein
VPRLVPFQFLDGILLCYIRARYFQMYVILLVLYLLSNNIYVHGIYSSSWFPVLVLLLAVVSQILLFVQEGEKDLLPCDRLK